MLRHLSGILVLVMLIGLSGCAVLVKGSGFQAAIPPSDTLRGVYHVHSEYSGDSQASLEDITRVSRRLGLDFVVVTDHNTLEASKQKYDFPRPPLFVFGEEVSTSKGHLAALGTETEAPRHLPPDEIKDWIRREGGVSVLAHPLSQRNPWRGDKYQGFDGIEVYNFAHTLYPANKVRLALRLLVLPPGVFLRQFQTAPEEELRYWDRLLEERPVAAWGATDMHLPFRVPGFVQGMMLLPMKSVTMYLPEAEAGREAVVEALGKGKSYLVFEARGEGLDFSFKAHDGKRRYDMGDEAAATEGLVFEVRTPRPAGIRLIHRGQVVAEAAGNVLLYEANKEGAYRVEVYRRGELWILSNPIYVTKLSHKTQDTGHTTHDTRHKK